MAVFDDMVGRLLVLLGQAIHVYVLLQPPTRAGDVP